MIVFFVFGELWFRMPWSYPLIDWKYDKELSTTYKPNQTGVILQGTGSIPSQPITINSNGFRNDEINWESPAILCLGSSEVLGTGVRNNECWPAVLQKQLRTHLTTNISVVNAGAGGYGPYHASIVLKRFLQKKKPILVIVRISTSDKDFFPPSSSSLSQKKVSIERNRIIKQATFFLPYLISKINAQKIRILSILKFPAKKNNSFLNTYEIACAGDTMWYRFKKYFESMSNDCEKNGPIPLVYLVYDPIETPATLRLTELVKDNLSHHTNTNVLFIGKQQFCLGSLSLGERKRITIQKYRIHFDPHANALQHSIVANELFEHILSTGYLK